MLGPTLRQGARFGGTAARLVSGHRSAFPSSLAAYCSAFVRAFLLRPFRFVLAAAAAPPALERNTRSPCAQMLGASAVRAALACSSVRVLTVPDRFSANGTPSPAPPTRANLAGHFGEVWAGRGVRQDRRAPHSALRPRGSVRERSAPRGAPRGPAQRARTARVRMARRVRAGLTRQNDAPIAAAHAWCWRPPRHPPPQAPGTKRAARRETPPRSRPR